MLDWDGKMLSSGTTDSHRATLSWKYSIHKPTNKPDSFSRSQLDWNRGRPSSAQTTRSDANDIHNQLYCSPFVRWLIRKSTFKELDITFWIVLILHCKGKWCKSYFILRTRSDFQVGPRWPKKSAKSHDWSNVDKKRGRGEEYVDLSTLRSTKSALKRFPLFVIWFLRLAHSSWSSWGSSSLAAIS